MRRVCTAHGPEHVTNMASATLEAVGASLLIYFITRQVRLAARRTSGPTGARTGTAGVFGTAVFVGMVCLSASATSTAPAHHRQCLRGSLMAWWWRGVLHAIDAPSSLLDARRLAAAMASTRRHAVAAPSRRWHADEIDGSPLRSTPPPSPSRLRSAREARHFRGRASCHAESTPCSSRPLC